MHYYYDALGARVRIPLQIAIYLFIYLIRFLKRFRIWEDRSQQPNSPRRILLILSARQCQLHHQESMKEQEAEETEGMAPRSDGHRA